MKKSLIGKLPALPVLAVLLGAPAQAQEIREVSEGNAVEALTIVIDGAFEPGLAKRFETFMETEYPDAFSVAFNSPGGDLIEGIKLGLLLRKYGLWTSVQRLLPGDGFIAEFDDQAICASACAFAFLGGKFRFLSTDQQLGFHQFYRSRDVDRLISDFDTEQMISGEAQFVSAMLIQYLDALGDVSPRVMMLAARTPPEDIYWVNREEAAELDIVSSSGWTPFWLEPYGKGVVAASRRLDAEDGYDPLHAYDLVAQATALCRRGERVLMLSTPFKVSAEAANYVVEWSFWDQARRQQDVMVKGGFELRGNEDQGWVDVKVSDEVAGLLQSSARFRVLIPFPRVLGGNYHFSYEPSEMDRSMIDAAFRICIS